MIELLLLTLVITSYFVLWRVAVLFMKGDLFGEPPVTLPVKVVNVTQRTLN